MRERAICILLRLYSYGHRFTSSRLYLIKIFTEYSVNNNFFQIFPHFIVNQIVVWTEFWLFYSEETNALKRTQEFWEIMSYARLIDQSHSNVGLEAARDESVADDRFLADDLADEEPAENLSCHGRVQHRLLCIEQLKFIKPFINI